MKYFLHDTNSFQDEKITELFIRYGYEGLGLFYTILEKLALQEKPVKTLVLKKQLSVGKKLEKAWSFLEEIKLIYSNNGETFNENLLKFSEKYQIKKENTRKRVAKWRDNQEVTENVTCYEHVSNTPKVKESKVKESKVNKKGVKTPGVCERFEQFWETYGKKEDHKKCLDYWQKLSPSEQETVLTHAPAYVKTKPDVQYRKYPLTYLNGEVWKEPVPHHVNGSTIKQMVY